jgi:hypothetical protein
MLRHTCYRLSGVVIAAAALAACDDVATHPRDALDSSFAILDGARAPRTSSFSRRWCRRPATPARSTARYVATINGGTLPIRFRIETAPAPLSADLIDPSSTSSGLFGGEVLALQFNVDFSDAGLISGSAGLAFGDTNVADALDYAHR